MKIIYRLFVNNPVMLGKAVHTHALYNHTVLTRWQYTTIHRDL